MSIVLTEEQQEVAKFALVAGVSKVSKTLSIAEEQLSDWVRLLHIEELKLTLRIKKVIVEMCLSKDLRVAAYSFGLHEEHVDKILNDYLSKTASKKRRSISVDAFTQTNTRSEEDYKDIEVQTDFYELGPCPVLVKNKRNDYPSADKISAVRYFMSHLDKKTAISDLNLSLTLLVRWRDKIRNQLFQEPHVGSIYTGNINNKDRFFQDLDVSMSLWYEKNKHRYNSAEEALLYKAKTVAKIEIDEPRVSDVWIEAFKKHYNIS